MGKNRKKVFNHKRMLEAKLTFYDLAENVLNRIRAKTTEKNKGLYMIELIENRFGISEIDMKMFRRKMIEMQKEAFKPTLKQDWQRKVKWHRNERGNIVSPFGVGK